MIFSDDRIAAALSLGSPGEITDELRLIADGCEAWLKTSTRRNWELRALADEPVPVEGARARKIFLPDYPVNSWTALKEATARDLATGAVTETSVISPSRYQILADRGVVRMRSECLVESGDRYLVSCSLGYTQAEIDDPATVQRPDAQAQLRMCLGLLRAVLRKQWALRDQGHITSLSFDGESSQIEHGLTKGEWRALNLIKRPIV